MDKLNAKLCGVLADKMRVTEEFSSDECEVINYMIFMLISETEKIIFLFGFFSLTGVRVPFLLVAAAVCLTHPFTGGMHRETFWGCLLQSTAFFAVEIFLGKTFTMPLFTVPIIYLITILIYLRFVPTTSEKRGEYGKKSRERIRIIALVGMSLVCVLSVMFIRCRSYFVWAIILEDAELIIINILKGVWNHAKDE